MVQRDPRQDSTRYAAIPKLLVEAVQESLICELEVAIPAKLAGAVGGAAVWLMGAGAIASENVALLPLELAANVAVVLVVALTAWAVKDCCVEAAATVTELGIDRVAPEAA